jgi:hypothetical protein
MCVCVCTRETKEVCVCMSVYDVHMSMILERYSKKTCERTKQMLSLLAKPKLTQQG